MTAAAPGRRGLLVDLSAAQQADGERVPAWLLPLVAALLEIPDAVRALLLDPALPLPGSLHPVLFSSPLLRWNTATELRRAALQGPVAYLVPAPPGLVGGGTLLPAPVAERDMPLVMVAPPEGEAPAAGVLASVGRELYRHADLVVVPAADEESLALAALGIEPGRAVPVPLPVSAEGGDASAWRRGAEMIVEAVQRVGSPLQSAGDAAPLRVALVGALPPSPAPSAAFVARLAETLAPRCRLALASDDRPDPAWLDRLGVPLQSIDSLARGGLAWAYDAVVHVVGSSADDLPALRSARRLPGVLWLHDERLAEPHRVEAASGVDAAAALVALLRRVYADRAPAPLLAALGAGEARAFDSAAERRYGLLLTGEVVRQARAVMVRSPAAARRVRLDQGASAPCPPIVVASDEAERAAEQLLAHVGSLSRRDGRRRDRSGARTEAVA